jgi:GntR family histidine utilization transcriptional repressor
VTKQFALKTDTPLCHVIALHMADSEPYVLENRWINSSVMPHLADVSFAKISANEWLLLNTPFTHGDIVFGAKNANKLEAVRLATKLDTALFVISRTTWDHDTAVTMVDLVFHAGHRKHTQL